jgi:single-strand DNA-binding protein
MGSLNRVVLLGNIGADVEVRTTPSGKAVANFSLATNEGYTKDGEREERTEWHRIVVWDQLATTCAKHTQKGSTVLVEGRLQTREYADKDGKAMFSTEVVASNVQFVGKGKDGKGRAVDGGTPEVVA